jgi:hypothetical protein
MKLLSIIILISLSIIDSSGQIRATAINNTWTGKVLNILVEIENQSNKDILINLDRSNYITQLSNPIKDNQLITTINKTPIPASFVVFYIQDSIIDDEVFRTDHYLASTNDFSISAHGSICLNYINSFIGYNTRRMLNDRVITHFEVYILYKQNGIIKYIKTPKMIVNY